MWLVGVPEALREEYGGKFGQRCLLARRLIQSGVRFVEVSHNLNFINSTGWDTHVEGQLNQHVLIQELDTALATLIRDLEKKGLLDKTLIATGTEFGRPAEFDRFRSRLSRYDVRCPRHRSNQGTKRFGPPHPHHRRRQTHRRTI